MLDAAANAYAAELSDAGVGVGQVIPLLLPRSAQLVAVQLAILKCGAAYANLDRRWPLERLNSILEQISPVLAVADDDFTAGRYTIFRPPWDIESGAARNSTFETPDVDGTAAATVFFTSGTTGGPKGVVSPHQAVTRLFGPGGLEGFGPGHVTPQAAPLPWDMYAFELWGQLTSGGTTVLVEGDHLLPRSLRDLTTELRVDTIWLTASLFNLFVDEDLDCFDGVKQVLTGGEKLSPEHVRQFLVRHPRISLWNGYGPAENCMLTTTRLLMLQDCDVSGGVPVGSAVPGTSVLILDSDGQRCAVGRPGEICIAGKGLATRYLGQPELTAEKFPTLTFNNAPLRIYRTGDIGLMDDEGIIHFRGRQDRQVKIAGHRVELAEIEETARALPGIRHCTAFALEAPDGQIGKLALIYLTEPGNWPGAQADINDPLHVRDHLLSILPDYMMPAVIRELSRYPVTANGKLDRSALLQIAHETKSSTRRARKSHAADQVGDAL